MSVAPAILLRAEVEADWPDVEWLNDAAFGGSDESRIIARLRAGKLIETALVATRDETIIGHIILSRLPTVIDGRVVKALALAPMAVAPEHQRGGVGSALVRAALDQARRAGWEAIIVLGHPGFYPRFGFSSALVAKLASPFSGDAFMALELVPGALDGARGEVVYPAAFGIDSASPSHD